MEDQLLPLVGDALDVRLLQTWAAQEEQLAEEVKRSFGAPVWQKGEIRRDAPIHHTSLGEVSPSASAIALARLACALSASSATLIHRWNEDQEKLASEPSMSKEVCRLSQDLLHARAERREAYHRLQDLQDRKQAAQVALAKAMEMEEEIEDDEIEDGHSPAPSETLSEHGDEQVVKKRGWSGAKRMLGKGLKKIRAGRKGKAESLTPPSAISPVSSAASGARTLSPQKPPTPKQLMVEASSEELVNTAEAIRQAAEEIDMQTSICEQVVEAIAESLRSGHDASRREAVRDGACALEEWADEVRSLLARWDITGSEAEGNTTAGDTTPKSLSDESDEEVVANDGDASWSLQRLQQLQHESEDLYHKLPPRFLLQCLCKGQEEGTSDSVSDHDPDSSNTTNFLHNLIKSNDTLEKTLADTRPASIVRAMRRCCSRLDHEAAGLENTATLVASAARISWQADSACTSPSRAAVSDVSASPSPRIGRTKSVTGLARGSRSRSSSRTSSPAQASRSGSRPATPRQGVPGRAVGLAASPRLDGQGQGDAGPAGQPASPSSPVSPSFGAGSSLRHAAAAEVVHEGYNPFEDDRLRTSSDRKDGVEACHTGLENDITNPFSDCSPDGDKETEGTLGNPFGFKSEEAAHRSTERQSFRDVNPFDDSVDESESDVSPAEDLAGNPFSVDRREDAGVSPVEETSQTQHFGSPASLAEELQPEHCFESPASFGEVQGAAMARHGMVSRPLCLEVVKDTASPRVTSLMPGAAPVLEMWRRPSPRQLPGGLAGCLCNGFNASRENEDLDEELRQVIDAPSLEAAIAASDASMCKGRLDAGDFRNWNWRDHAAEEGHQVLGKSTHFLSDMLADEDWGFFSYELLLLSRHFLREGSPALDQVSALIPICRVRLGINSQLHHHIVELCKPSGSEAFSPLDVRYRVALLLRLWTSWETFEYGTLADSSKEWTQKWIHMQLRVLKGCILERAMQLHEGQEDLSACGRCLQALRELTEIALSGSWGKPQALERMAEPSGRRLLAMVFKEMDALRPLESWSFNVVFAAKVFGTLWRAATDAEAEDRLSLDAPLVAAALLAGLHPHLAPLQLETHALLFTQQLWSATFSPSMLQLPAAALAISANILSDFSHWLQKTPVDAAACFARQGAPGSSQQPLELIARRLLTVDLRDQLVQTLTDYRRHFEPSAFAAALELWERCFRETRRSDVGRGRSNEAFAEDAEEEHVLENGSTEELFRCFGQWFVWQSASKEAELALQPFDEPPRVPIGDEVAWKRLGPEIKKYLEGLTDAVQSLIEELDCEKTFYNEAWAAHGLGPEHLAVAAAAVVGAVRPRVEILKAGVWPTGPPILEVPPGGGRLIQVLEALDREASRHRETNVLTTEPLVDILVPHVTSALAESLAALDRDITSKALDGDPESLFVPLRPPSSIYCQAVVTLWRFIHDALDAPLSLGLPVDIVVSPFIKDFLGKVLQRSAERFVRPCEDREAFGMSIRAAQVADELKSTNCAVDSEEDEGPAKISDAKRSSGRGRKKFLTKLSGRSLPEEVTKNSVMEVRLLEVSSKVIAAPVRQVMVRLSSIGFCLAELADVHTKLFKMVNSGDDDGVPTARHNEARMLICEELPELQESLLHQGQTLARYLAARLVYHELRAELFEKLYFVAVPGGGTPTPSNAVGSFTPRASTTPASFLESGPGPTLLTLKDIVASRQNSFLSLVEQAPSALLGAFVAELGIELTHAWMYVIVDYLRKQQLDQIYDHLASDQEALSRAIDSMMQATRQRVQTKALGGLTLEDCRNAEKRLEEVQRLSRCLIEETRARTAEELARYAAKVRGEFSQEGRDVGPSVLARERSQTPTPLGRSKSPHPRSASPSGASAGAFGGYYSPRSPSPVLVSPRDGPDSQATSSRSARQRFQGAWKAMKRLGKAHKEMDVRDSRQ
eukprot:s1603_g5.t1